MVFIGGTDPGAFINTFLNETSDGEQHIIFTQNALADGSYLDYLNTIYGDRLKLPDKSEQDAAFSQYVADVAKRAAHDREFPDEPKQLRAGENFPEVNGKPQVSGQTAVMSINETLLGWVLEKNPDLSFALEESFSLKSTYKDAAPLGPVMELRAGEEDQLTSARAAEAVQNWRSTAKELLESTTEKDEYPRKAWSHTAAAQANLLMNRNFLGEAEETYQLARQMYPDGYEAAVGLAELYRKTGRAAEAEQVLKGFH
jgi:tetratricopeptide (TPR) repeat protein